MPPGLRGGTADQQCGHIPGKRLLSSGRSVGGRGTLSRLLTGAHGTLGPAPASGLHLCRCWRPRGEHRPGRRLLLHGTAPLQAESLVPPHSSTQSPFGAGGEVRSGLAGWGGGRQGTRTSLRPQPLPGPSGPSTQHVSLKQATRGGAVDPTLAPHARPRSKGAERSAVHGPAAEGPAVTAEEHSPQGAGRAGAQTPKSVAE